MNTIPLEGAVSDDPTPDLVMISPNGGHAFLSLRGPNPLTADPHVSTGSTPGVGVLKVTEGGRNAVLPAVRPSHSGSQASFLQEVMARLEIPTG